MNKYKVSVVITAYNIEEYIEKSVTSVIEQSFDGYEIILVDDGSTDSTVDKAIALLKTFPDFKVITQTNSRAGGARNTGIHLARGEYICFLDGDDWLLPDALASMHGSIEQFQADALCSNRVIYREKQNNFKNDSFIEAPTAGQVNEVPKIMHRIAIHGRLFKKSFLVQNDIYFPENMSVEDFVFSYQLLASRPVYAHIPQVTYAYRIRAGENASLTQSRLCEFSLKSRFRQIELTEEIIHREGGLAELYPKVDFDKLNYQTRLMRHVKALAKTDDALLARSAIEMIAGFIGANKDIIFRSINKPTSEIYEAILEQDLDKVKALIAATNKKKKGNEQSSALKQRPASGSLGEQQNNAATLPGTLANPDNSNSEAKKKQLTDNQDRRFIYASQAILFLIIRQRVQQRKKVSIGFVVSDNTKWNASPLLQALSRVPEFEVSILLTLSGRDKTVEARRAGYAKERAFFSQLPVPLVDLYDAEADKKVAPPKDLLDLVFFQQPWGMGQLMSRLCQQALALYMPYGYLIYQNYHMEYKKPEFHPYLWRYFSQSEMHKQIQLEQDPSAAEAILVTGYPKLDVYQQAGPSTNPPWPGSANNKRIIYAPHHSLPKERMSISTFHWNYDLLLDLANENQNTSWIYRPHARLKYVVEKNGVMSKAAYFDYEASWDSLANGCVYAEGEYFDVFKSSDVLITDCSSFLGEYMPTGKPVIWLVSDKPGFALNPVGQRITDTYYKVHSREELVQVFKRVVLDGDDYLKEKRLEVMRTIFSATHNAAESIVSHLHHALLGDNELWQQTGSLQESLIIDKAEIRGITAIPAECQTCQIDVHLDNQPIASIPVEYITPAIGSVRWCCFTIPMSRALMRYVADKKAVTVSANGKKLAVTSNTAAIWREVNRLPQSHLRTLLSKGWHFSQAMSLIPPYPSALKHGFDVKLSNLRKPYCSITISQSKGESTQAGEVALFVDDLPLGVALFADANEGVASFSFNLNKKLLAEIYKRHSIQFEVNSVRYLLPLSVFEPLLSEIKEIIITKPQVLGCLNNGYELNQKGRLAKPKNLDSAWLSNTLALYHKACAFFKDRFNYTLYLTGGTLLGYARAGGVISFDKDFDSGYLSAHTEPSLIKEEFKNIIISLLKAGEDIRLLTPIGDKIRCDYFMWHDKSGSHIDVFPGAFINGKYRRPTFVDTQLTKDDFFPFKEASFNGYQVFVPQHVDKKVAAVYGQNWRYPDPFWKKVRSPEIVEYRKQIMLTERDCLEIASVSKLEGERIKQLISDGKFKSQL